ncbi:MAG: Predicted nucleic acid-binding protein, contains PIN domain [Candidatus Kentron sp. G]|nr:MAG: Predicted nucleic acid-binding protein, contains PIN domain [Candidatus Kentron sp. G]
MVDTIRVVIDTNHIMPAILSSKGASAKSIDWMTKEEDYFTPLISDPIWKEYRTVADWLIPKTRHSEKIRIMDTLFSQSEKIEPGFRSSARSHESDNRFLECAVAGSADYLRRFLSKNIPTCLSLSSSFRVAITVTEFTMRLLLLLESERKSCAIRYILFCQSPYHQEYSRFSVRGIPECKDSPNRRVSEDISHYRKSSGVDRIRSISKACRSISDKVYWKIPTNLRTVRPPDDKP